MYRAIKSYCIKRYTALVVLAVGVAQGDELEKLNWGLTIVYDVGEEDIKRSRC
jgi:hypothetical protein